MVVRLSAWLLLASACVLDDVPLEGLPCPCAEEQGWQCLDGVCVQGDFLCGRQGEDLGSVGLSNLRVEWETPNQVRLAWDAEADTLFEYFVDISEEEAGFTQRAGERTVDASENRELARSFLLDASGADAVERTTIRELEPDTRYFMRVVARDQARRVTCTNIVATRTALAPTSALALFADEHPNPNPAFPVLPACVERVEDSARSRDGSAHYALQVACAQSADGDVEFSCDGGDEPRCFENVRVTSVRTPLSLTAGALRTAYFEVAVAIESDVEPGGWGDLGFSSDLGGHFDGRHTFVADGTYHVYQVPLRVLPRLREIAGGLDLVVNQTRIGAAWSAGTVIRMDELFIRW